MQRCVKNTLREWVIWNLCSAFLFSVWGCVIISPQLRPACSHLVLLSMGYRTWAGIKFYWQQNICIYVLHIWKSMSVCLTDSTHVSCGGISNAEPPVCPSCCYMSLVRRAVHLPYCSSTAFSKVTWETGSLQHSGHSLIMKEYSADSTVFDLLAAVQRKTNTHNFHVTQKCIINTNIFSDCCVVYVRGTLVLKGGYRVVKERGRLIDSDHSKAPPQCCSHTL